MLMNCSEVRQLLSAFHDGEVDLVTDRKVRTHLADCPECRSELEGLGALSKAVSEVPRSKASEDLRKRIAASLPAQTPQPRRSWGLGLAFAAGAMATLLVIGFVLQRSTVGPESLTSEILDSHVSALMSGRLVDVTSSDQHTVKPWFAGKVPISPTPWNLTSDGFPLIGGRLEVVQGRPSPVFVYRRRKHLIDLFVLASASGGSWKLDRQGYTMIAWPREGLEFIAVSDVDPSDLQRFVDLYSKQG